MRQRATVLIADDHPIVADALFTSLKRWFSVTGVITELDDLEDEIEATRPRIVLLDISFGNKSSLPLLPGLVLTFPRTRFVILTAHADPVLADAAMLAGAAAFVLKHSAGTELRVAIQEALAGRKYITPRLERGGAGGSTDAIDDQRIALSERQRDILGLLRAGHTYRVIADKLGISSKTVEYHVDSLTRRLGIRGKSQLIRWSERFFSN